MKKLLLATLAAFCCMFSWQLSAQQVQALNGVNLPAPTPYVFSTPNAAPQSLVAPVGCGPDTILYASAKATGLQGLNINNATSAQAASQYFDCPQAITISGFRYYAYSITLPTLPVTASLYLAGPDSMPTGMPLATTVNTVDSTFGGGALINLTEYAVFSTPVTMTQPYVLVVSNLSANGMGLISNSYQATPADGAGEFLASVDLFGTWTRGYGINVGGNTFDADWLFEPMVTYDLSTNFALSTPCLSTPNQNVAFTNGSSPILQNRMYNQAAFVGNPRLSYTWNFGDGSPAVNAIDTNHTYTTPGNYTVSLTDTIYGWTTLCVNDTMANLGASPTPAFTSAPAGLQVAFANTTPGTISQSWNFGDGNTSTAASPTHTYATPGGYTVCLTVTDQCGTSTTCEVVTVFAPGVCGGDSVQYPLAKATGVQFLNINNATSAQAIGQYFNAPQPITIYGFDFIGWTSQANLASVTVTCEVRSVGADSLPTGPALASTTFVLDSVFGGGTLAELTRHVGFANPPTVTGPYVITVTNASPNEISLVSNSYTNADGASEWLGSVDLFGTWTPGYGVNVGGTAFNADWMIYPLVTYDLNANFSLTPPCLNAAGTVTFTNASSPILGDRMYNRAAFFGAERLSYTWDFGDASPQVNAVDTNHVYTAAGPYTVTLTDTIFGWTSDCTADTTMPIQAQGQAAFTSSTSSLAVSFTDASTGAPTSYLWDFGDGNTSTAQNPNHTYATPGNYTVCLTISDICGSDSTCSTVSVTCPAPNAAFSSSSTLLAANFTDNSTGSMISNYLWDFGDGNTSTQQSPSHTYAAGGTYTVCLTITDLCGTDSTCTQVTISCPAPSPAFSSSSNLLTTNFTDNSTGNSISSYLWDFGDGNTSTTQSPSHTYAAGGTYTVCLTITDACGTDSTCNTVTVNCPAPNAAFSSSSNLLTANFTDNSTGNTISSYAWDFGDGNTSTMQSPSHTYAAGGTYTVCLVVTDVCGNDTTCTQVTINCPAPSAAFSSSTNLLSATFTDNSSGNSISSYAWDFGDGNTSTTMSPSHTYASAGVYTVCLVITDACGADTTCNTVTVNCPAPSANFSASSSLLAVNFTDNSTGNTISSYAWDFGDGNTSTAQNPSHLYASGGTYTVCLVITDLCGSDTSCQTLAVSCPLPQAGFTFTNNNLTFNFMDASTTVANASWSWNFGDGNFSTQQSPTHTYATDGSYTVCMILTDSCGSDTSCQTLNVVGIDDALAQRIDLYPNPAQDQVNVALDLASPENTNVRIFNALGEMVREYSLEGVQQKTFPVDLSSFSNGTYLFEFRIGDKRTVKRLNVVR